MSVTLSARTTDTALQLPPRPNHWLQPPAAVQNLWHSWPSSPMA